MRYDYLTPQFNQQQPAEIQTPNSQGTDLQQNVQMNNAVTQPAITQPVNTNSNRPTEQMQSNTGSGQVSDENVMQPATTQNQVQSTMNQQNIVQPSSSSITVKRATDLNDTTVQSYLNDYQNGVNINDYQAQINALTAIDNYRTSKGLQPIYKANVLELNNQRNQKIDNQIKDFENDLALAYSSGNYDIAQQIGQQLEDYKKMVNYQTPTFDNEETYLNNVRYKSDWDSYINKLALDLYNARFTYNPSDDEALMKAQQYASNVVYESMNAKGILDSTMTAQMVTKTVNDLIPVYQKMAKEEFYENVERLQTMANFIIKLDDRDYSRWQDEVTMQLQRYEAKKKAISDEWDRVNKMGYVDNTASILLGVPVGTLSPSKRQAIDEAKAEIEKENRKLQSDITLAEAKKQLDYQYGIQEYADKASIDISKARTKANINVSEYAQKQAIASQYKNSGTGSSKIYGGGTKYEGTAKNIKELISDNYEKTRNLNQAISDINTNFPKSADRAKAYKDILDMTEDEAYELGIFNTLEETYGELTDATELAYLSGIAELGDQGLDDNMVKVLSDKVEAKLKDNSDFKNIYSTYEKMLNQRIDNVKDKNKKAIQDVIKSGAWGDEKTSVSSENNSAQFINKYGEEKYNQLITMIREKEEEISRILKNKGIDW